MAKPVALQSIIMSSLGVVITAGLTNKSIMDSNIPEDILIVMIKRK